MPLRIIMCSIIKRVILRKFRKIAAAALAGSIVVGIAVVVLDRKLCISESCRQLSARIISRMDTAVSPCDDFYRFACGKLLEEDTEPDRQHSILLSEADRLQDAKVRSMMVDGGLSDSEVSKKVSAFIKACGPDWILEQAAQELHQFRTDAGLFPSVVGEKFKEESWNIMIASGKLRELGLDFTSLFDVDVYYDPTVPSRLILCLKNPPDLMLSIVNCDRSCESDYVRRYMRIVKAFDSDAASGEDDAREVMNFEKGLANNAIQYWEERNSLIFEENVKTAKVLTARYGFLDWVKYLEIVTASEISDKISDETPVLVFNSGYLDQLNKTLAATSPKVLANYMMWYALRHITDWSCSAWVEHAIPVPLQKAYLQRFGSDRRRAFIVEMIHIIQAELKESIVLSDWLDYKAKTEAIAQIDEIYLRLVSSDSLDTIDYRDYYENVDISGNFTFLLNLHRRWHTRKYELLEKSVDRDAWDMVVLVFELKLYSVNLVVTGADNSLTILDGYLQQPVHDEDWPGYLNYGRLGTAVAHAITHSLDYRSRHFDLHGSVRKWWSDQSIAKFKVKEKCFISQLRRLKHFGKNDNYLPTAESISGTAELKLAFEAYRKYEDSLIFRDLLLPGVSYTQEQMYFIGHAHLHCSRDLEPIYILDHFLPAEFRVSSSIQNSVYFGDVFGCKKGSKMNPTEKCEIWM